MPVFASRLTLAYVLSVAPVLLGALGASSCTDRPSTSGHEATSVGSQPVINGIVQSDSDSIGRPVVMLREIAGRLIGSGVVLTPNVVLMSAHEVCKYARTPTVLEVLRGNPDVALAMEVQDIIIHPRYVPGEQCGGKTKDQSGIDLALVFLRADIWPTISANIASPVTALPSTVRCESHIMQSKDPSIDTQNYAFFPVLAADPAPSGYFMTDVNAPFQQHLDHGDSGGPCFTEQGDKLVGIVSAMLVTKEFEDRHGIIVDARQENFWILGTAMPTTDASLAYDWDQDGTAELARVTRDSGALALVTTPSGGGAAVALDLTLSSTPDNVQAFALGNFDNRGRSIALLGDGELSVVNLNDWSAETYGHGYVQLISQRLEADSFADLVAFRSDGTSDVYRGGADGLTYQSGVTASFLQLDPGGVIDVATVDHNMLRVASSNSEVPFSSLPLSFVQPGPALQVSGRFRKFSSPGDQGIEDLVVEEGGEVIYVKASGSGGFGNWSWLHRPSASGNVKVTDLNVVDVNGDGVDDLSLTLSDDTLALFIGGTSNGLSSAVKQTSPLIVGDITLDACVDLKDWQILNDNYGYPVSAGSAARADLNGDGWVDYFDYLKLVQHWGEGSGCP